MKANTEKPHKGKSQSNETTISKPDLNQDLTKLLQMRPDLHTKLTRKIVAKL